MGARAGIQRGAGEDMQGKARLEPDDDVHGHSPFVGARRGEERGRAGRVPRIQGDVYKRQV